MAQCEEGKRKKKGKGRGGEPPVKEHTQRVGYENPKLRTAFFVTTCILANRKQCNI